MYNQSSANHFCFCNYSSICLAFLLLLLLLILSSCSQTAIPRPTESTPATVESTQASIPQLQKKLQVPSGIGKGVLSPNHQVYFAAYDYVPILDGLSLVGNIDVPKYDLPYGTILGDIEVNQRTGLVYVLDQYVDVIHVISGTKVITSLAGIVEDPLHVVADQDSSEVYVFYTAHVNDKVEPRALVLSGTTTITDIALPLFTQSVAYNPIDGHIYAVGHIIGDGMSRENAMITIDDYQVLNMIRPLDEPQLAVVGLAINEKNGDVYVLLVSKVVYWDRVNPLKSIDLYASGYTGLQCITVDPIRGWAYVCAWMVNPSYALVIDKNILKAAIPIDFRPQDMAVDVKHDYVYVAHYSPTMMSVIRETKLITTLDTLGDGATAVIVDEERNYIYVPNADDGSVSIFGFE